MMLKKKKNPLYGLGEKIMLGSTPVEPNEKILLV